MAIRRPIIERCRRIEEKLSPLSAINRSSCRARLHARTAEAGRSLLVYPVIDESGSSTSRRRRRFETLGEVATVRAVAAFRIPFGGIVMDASTRESSALLAHGNRSGVDFKSTHHVDRNAELFGRPTSPLRGGSAGANTNRIAFSLAGKVPERGQARGLEKTRDV